MTKNNRRLERRAGRLQDELVALAHQYLNDMRHPVTDAGSMKRRIEAIEEVLKKNEKF